MFVFSVRANKPKLIIILCAVAVALLILILALRSTGKPVANDGAVSYKAADEEQRIAFLSQFGWKIKEDPVEVTEVIIPSEFNDAYASYNEIQKNQGLDLEPYKGSRVKKWVYEVQNYPDITSEKSPVRATLLVLDGIVIGGDVSSVIDGGFMQGFEYPNEELNATVNTNE